MMDLYLHMGAALILVSGLVVLIGLAVKKKQGKESLMKIMGYQSLGPKKGMAMVRIGREVLLLGVTANDVKLLKTMDRFEEASEQPRSFEKTMASMAASAPATFEAFVDDNAAVNRRQYERTDRVIVADTSEKLKKLRAMKDALVCN